MCYACNVMATLLSDGILAEQSLCTSASRCSALLTRAPLSALPQERPLFPASGRWSTVCWWMKQPHGSNSTQKRAVVLTDTQAGSSLRWLLDFPNYADRNSPVLGTGRAVHRALSFTHSVSLCSHFLPLTH